MTEDHCPICKNPKLSSGKGSLTQWIVACQCGLVGSAGDASDQIQLCRTCGKRIDAGRAGSFTQFIFRYDSCRCKIPKSLDEALKASARSHHSRETVEKSIDEEAELDLDKDAFPTDRYKPLVQLGAGASGVVFLARDKMLHKKVAIKVLRRMSSSVVISFQEEARTTSKLKHRYIVDLLDFGVTPGGAPYMVLEYILGPSLEEALRRVGSLKLRDFFSVFRRVCEALAYAHRNGVFHRDLKPGNILLTTASDGVFEVRVIDFGLAKIMSDNLKHSEHEHLTLAGTPLYMSPDQGFGRAFDARSEVYSLGCVMFEALTGRPPFESDTALELLALHADEAPPRLVEVLAANPTSLSQQKVIPAQLEELVQHCLSKNPDERYQSMDELIEDLKNTEIACSDQASQENDADPASPLKTRSRTWVYAGIALSGLSIAVFSYFASIKVNDRPAKALSQTPTVRFFGETKAKSLRSMVSPNATVVSINGGLTDAEFKELGLYTNAQQMDLSNNLITDEATSYINSPHLESLRVNNTGVKTLEYISKLKSLVHLSLAGTSVPAAALSKLSSLPNLSELDIRGLEVDDKDTDKIRSIKSLTVLIHRDNCFSQQAFTELVRDMPGCNLRWLAPRTIQPTQIVALLNNHQYTDLETALKDSVSALETAQGKDAPLLAKYYMFQGACSIKQNRLKEAKLALNRSLAVSRKTGYTLYLMDAFSNLQTIAIMEHDVKRSDFYGEKVAAESKRRFGVTAAEHE